MIINIYTLKIQFQLKKNQTFLFLKLAIAKHKAIINQFIVAFLLEKKLPVDIMGQNKTNNVNIGA